MTGPSPVINRASFFKHCREAPFGGAMSQTQVDGMNFILDGWDKDLPGCDLRWLAYALGTTYHETGSAMMPVREGGGNNYFYRMYDPNSPLPKRAELAKRMGARPGDGIIFYGRGDVQITWYPNYLKMEHRFGIDLTSGPEAADRALEPKLAARIMFEGMSKGVFTGKKFSDYFGPGREDWVEARRIINGTDRAALVASYAKSFYKALTASA